MSHPLPHTGQLDLLCINTIRTLALDAIQQANSGHPGAPMALAPAAYTLWSKVMRYNPENPQWFNRDRFVLSNGHASMLLYAMLFLTGYDLSLDDIKAFRQLGSKTPGHPEHMVTPGVETTTGPLGQGFMNAVGMAIAEAHLAAVFNREGFEIVNHHTYVFCSDGDFMEGASHEAASLAGHLGLGKLIVLYDDNHISIEGNTDITYSDDVKHRFESYHWHVQDIGDNANAPDTILQAYENALQETGRPSLIILRTHIGYGSPHYQDSPDAHGAPLGAEEVALTKKAYSWPEHETFIVPEEVLQYMRQAVTRGRTGESDWNVLMASYKKAYPELAARLEAALKCALPEGWDRCLPVFAPDDGSIATRSASGKVINAFADIVPCVLGGSADLAPSNNSLIKNSGYFSVTRPADRNIAWGIREHTMCACSSGMALHGGIRPFAATFFVFTDYARPAIRLAALMGLPVIYVMTHDSIGLGEDGPTHQPIEQLASLRAIPNLCIIRPADANETVWAWKAALERTSGPTMLVLTRQKVPVFDRRIYSGADGLLKGAYILSREKGSHPEALLIATGSEVELVLCAQEKLLSESIDARVVSMPCWELFREQPLDYRNTVLPPDVPLRLAVEAGSPLGWREWVGDAGSIVAMTSFGASAPYKELRKKYGFTVDNIVGRVNEMLHGRHPH